MDFSPIIAIYLSISLAACALVVWWAVAVPRIALLALFGALVAGQVGRVPLPGQGGGLLVSDIAVLLVLVSAIGYVWRSRRPIPIPAKYLILTIFLFLIWSGFPLALQFQEIRFVGVGIAGAYWVRLGSYLLLLPALYLLLQDTHLRKLAFTLSWWTGALLAVLGFIQLGIAPKIAGFPRLLAAGWDPHVNRLVATWFDPNFIGAFFGMAIIYALFALYSSNASSTKKGWIAILMAVWFLALAFTRSRSSVIAFAAALFALSAVTLFHILVFARRREVISVQIIVVMSGVVLAGVFGAALLGERLPALVFNDPTVSLRAESLQAAWRVFGPKTILLGEGYNVYQFVALREGIGDSFSTHSRAGLDNSFLTLWVTTGVIGIMLFVLPWIYASFLGWRNAWRNKKLIGIVPLALLVFLSTHAQFVNSFLYGHLLIVLAIFTVLAIQESE